TATLSASTSTTSDPETPAAARARYSRFTSSSERTRDATRAQRDEDMSQTTVVLVHRDDYERGQLRLALETLDGVQIAGERGALREAIERVQHQAAKKSGGGASRGVVTVFSNKGGAGVSTIATNLAISLKRMTGREVALADFDIHSGDAAFMLGLSPTRSLGD